ncbi:uncharacterized protein LALA0_S05e02234g [Lachancea lanzarotensis]|uniref:LALA0S05e02234g1_1 n=1 Tax=Lachancea lanzarotensis TaxID=1245769 RepID=A0A0C7N9Y5_9SACH|nr:uncharacterized protein LALA0_S05e02234g [Lachancea lanzarotensis]CEP62291.1 LALA0S05e02234g1_1 [Lachancea lanzarotensis]
MGYIQFDKIAVPDDNLVSLGLLHRQLQKQQESHRLLETWSVVSSETPGKSHHHAYDSLDELQDPSTTTLVPSSVSPDDRSFLTGLTPTSESLDDIWADLVNSEHTRNSQDRHQGDHQGDDHDEGFANLHGTTTLQTASHAAVQHHNNNSNNENNSHIGALVHAGRKSSLDEKLLGTQFSTGSPFTDLELLSPYTTDISVASTSSSSGGDVTFGQQAPPVFECQHCYASFKVKGYLSRHLRKHQVVKDFQCPYWAPECQCHSTGAFSRKDSYKMHLKAIHFVYPVGVAKTHRNRSKGRCAACYQEFDNNTEWFNQHVATRSCEGMLRVKQEPQD